MSMIDDRDRPAGAKARGASNPIDDDPLAELIRIVKEEDPFGDVLAWQPGTQDTKDTAASAEARQPEKPAAPPPHQPVQPPRQERPAPSRQPVAPQANQPQPHREAQQARAEAPPQDARSARRRGPPPLEPIALEEALREFREVPDEHYKTPRDEYDPAAIPDDDGHAESEPVAAAPDYSRAPEQVQHAAYHEEAQERPEAEAYYGDVIEDEADAYNDPAFADVGRDDYADEGQTPVAYEQEHEHGAAPVRPDAAYVAAEQAPRGRRGLFFGAGVVLGLVVLAGLFMTLFQTGGDAGSDGPLPVIRASNDPSKVAPSDPGGANIPNQERLVYNRVSGQEGEPDTRLVSREEEVMEQGGDKAPDRFPGLNGSANRGEDIGKNKPDAIPAAASPDQNNSVTPQPRRVRTLTIGPDGSISAAAEEPPAPPVRAQPEPSVQPVRTAEAAPQPDPLPRATVTPTRPTRSDTPSVQPIRQANAQEPVRRTQTQGAPLALNPNPVAAPRQQANEPSAPVPVQQQQAPVRQQVAAVTPAATTSTPPAVASQGDYVVQLAARKSEEQALGAYDALQGQYSGLLGRYKPLIQRADLGDRGVYYRVRVGPMANADSANQLCDQLKAAGLNDCLVRRR